MLLERGDQVFACAANASFAGAKPFDQSYRRGFAYLAWRGGG